MVGYELHTPQINSAAHPNLYYPLKDSRATILWELPSQTRQRSGRALDKLLWEVVRSKAPSKCYHLGIHGGGKLSHKTWSGLVRAHKFEHESDHH